MFGQSSDRFVGGVTFCGATVRAYVSVGVVETVVVDGSTPKTPSIRKFMLPKFGILLRRRSEDGI